MSHGTVLNRVGAQVRVDSQVPLVGLQLRRDRRGAAALTRVEFGVHVQLDPLREDHVVAGHVLAGFGQLVPEGAEPPLREEGEMLLAEYSLAPVSAIVISAVPQCQYGALHAHVGGHAANSILSGRCQRALQGASSLT